MKTNRLFLVISGLIISVFLTTKVLYPQTGGPMVSTVYSLAISGSTILAGTNSGIFRSSDNGKTWSQTSIYNQITQSICSNGKVFITSKSYGGLYSSSDNGMTWEKLPEHKNFFKWSRLESIGSVFFAGTNKGLFTSEDNGQHWTQTSLDSGTVERIFSNGSTIFAGTKRFGNSWYGIYTSDNNGRDWKKIFDPQTHVKSIAASVSDIYVLTEKNKIFRSTDSGESWTKISFEPICFNLCASGSNIIAGTYKGLFVSSDNGETWRNLLPDKSIYSIISNDSLVFCGTKKYGLYVSSNYGLDWTQSSLINLEIKPKKFEKKQIKGHWEDFVLPPLMEGNLVTITFSADSFFYNNSRYSCIVDKPCSRYVGVEFASGEFTVDDNYIYLSGYWTDKTYNNILTEAPCNAGEFGLKYQYEYYTNHMLHLRLIESVQAVYIGVKSELYLYKK